MSKSSDHLRWCFVKSKDDAESKRFPFLSRWPLSALIEGEGAIACLVCCDDDGVHLEWCVDATEALRAFARWCGVRLLRCWDAPEVVIRWLRWGLEVDRKATDETIKAMATPVDRKVWVASQAAWNSTLLDRRRAAISAALFLFEVERWNTSSIEPNNVLSEMLELENSGWDSTNWSWTWDQGVEHK